MAAAALTMLHTAGAELLDPDFDPWGIGSPASKGFSHHAPAPTRTEHLQFPTVLGTVRDVLRMSTKRPLRVYTAIQEGPVPADATLLSPMYYLSFDGHLVSIEVRHRKGRFAVQLTAR
jgi:hypothetical protein